MSFFTWPFVRVTYAGIDNPMFVDDIQAADEAVISAALSILGVGPTDFAILWGLEFDGSTNYSPGAFVLNEAIYYIQNGCTTGQFLTGTQLPALFEGFDDGNQRVIYNVFLGSAANAGGAGYSPQFEGNMDTYRIGSLRLMQAVNALNIIAASLGSAAFLNVGQAANTVMAGNDPRAPYTAAQLDARYAQIANVIIKGAGTPYTPVLETDPATRGYVDSVAITKLASGRSVLGDIPSGGATLTISFGVTLPNTSYMLIPTLVGLGNPVNDATSHAPVMIDSSKTTSSVQMRFQEGVGVAQNIAVDWILIPH